MLQDAAMLGGEPGTGTGRLLASYFKESSAAGVIDIAGGDAL